MPSIQLAWRLLRIWITEQLIGIKMAYCDVCGNFDASHDDRKASRHSEHYRPELYYYWDAPLEEDYDWRDNFPEADCLCEICFDIANEEGKIKWNKKNPFELMLDPVND